MYRVWCVLRQSSSILRSTVTVSGSPRFLSTYTSINVDALSPRIKQFVEENAKICQPDNIYVCDGSNEENTKLIEKLQQDGRLDKLTKYDNCYLARTSKEDVARVEKQTYICSEKVEDAVPIPKSGNHEDSRLGHWKAPSEMDKELSEKFTGCMKGRTMYIIPFSMGPVGSPLSKYGIQLTDSEYVVASMRIMTRMGKEVLDTLGNDEFVKCLHSVGAPILPGKEDTHWPCNPKNIAIAHFPERNEIKSFGSGYGGNSLLGKKCFALRIATILARREGWLAEHMLILGLTNPEGRKKYIAAAFPSQCGKTNLAMITPTLPGWKAECVGDDIAWMRFGADGKLRAINPENGFFGVAPGTNTSSNPNAMGTIFKDTIFTNVASTSDGGAYWKGLEDETPKGVSITSWLNEENWQDLSDEEKKKRPAAHPNSRFCAPAGNCPIIDPRWEDPEGVPIDAILFGGRRPTTVPLVFESFNWQHGVFVGASMRSKATSAAEHTGDEVMHDPFAMRPFYGYSFAQYMAHWLSLQQRPGVQLPKIFHVNWFRQSPTDGSFIWPGFGENCRVLDWIFQRCDNEDIAQPSPLGLIPKPGTLDITGLNMKDADIAALFDTFKEELEKEAKGIEEYFNDQLPGQVPGPVEEELAALKARIAKL